jgi:6,7-dimethyl-8-ribityllumazine synthase
MAKEGSGKKTKKLPRVLIVEARFYGDIADQLARGAMTVLEDAGVDFERVEVPGALEVPGAIAMVEQRTPYDGYVALGCVIRGETGHYDVVAGQSARALMDLTLVHGIALGNGILTVEDSDQAMARASIGGKNKGGAAAAACLDMIGLKTAFSQRAET